MRLRNFLGLPLLAVIITGCCCVNPTLDLLSEEFVSYTVVLIPNVAANRLDVLSDPQGWDASGKQKGWVGFDEGEQGTITFALDAPPSRPRCTNDNNTSAEWVISKIELSKNGNPNTQKGNNFGTNQKGWISDAFPQVNPSNGEIQDSAIGSISVVVENLNNNKSNDKKYGYYQVTATRCSDQKELVTDPGWGNGGKK